MSGTTGFEGKLDEELIVLCDASQDALLREMAVRLGGALDASVEHETSADEAWTEYYKLKETPV